MWEHVVSSSRPAGAPLPLTFGSLHFSSLSGYCCGYHRSAEPDYDTPSPRHLCAAPQIKREFVSPLLALRSSHFATEFVPLSAAAASEARRGSTCAGGARVPTPRNGADGALTFEFLAALKTADTGILAETGCRLLLGKCHCDAVSGNLNQQLRNCRVP